MSWEDAENNAVKEGFKNIKNIASLYVQEQSTVVKDVKIVEYRTNVKITFEVKRVTIQAKILMNTKTNYYYERRQEKWWHPKLECQNLWLK